MGDLVCSEKCDQQYPGVPSSSDCCALPETCLGVAGDGSCCTVAIPCARGHGDCDNDSQCEKGLTCGRDNCQDFREEALPPMDCCE